MKLPENEGRLLPGHPQEVALLYNVAWPARSKGNTHADTGTLLGRALDGERSPRLCDALQHGTQSEVARVGSGRVEAAPVILHFQRNFVLAFDNAHNDFRSASMLDNVV